MRSRWRLERNRLRWKPLLGVLLTCSMGLSNAHADSRPFLQVDTDAVPEGDADNVVAIEWRISGITTEEVRFTVRTDETEPATATPGEDYVVMPPTEVYAPPGQERGWIN